MKGLGTLKSRPGGLNLGFGNSKFRAVCEFKIKARGLKLRVWEFKVQARQLKLMVWEFKINARKLQIRVWEPKSRFGNLN